MGAEQIYLQIHNTNNPVQRKVKIYNLKFVNKKKPYELMFCIVLVWFGKNLLQALFTFNIFPLYHLSYLLLYYRTNFMFTCEECEYNCAKEKDLKTHTTSRHANKKNEDISKQKRS